MRRVVASMAAVLLVGNGVHANAPPPRDMFRPSPKLIAADTPITVTADSPDEQIHLRMPRRLAKAAAPAHLPADFGATDSRHSTVLAGIALSGAAVAAGFWLLRYRKKPVPLGKAAATTGATLLLFGCGWWQSWLNDPVPPPEPISGALCSGRVVIEPVDEGDEVQVQLPKDLAAKVGENAQAR